MVSPNLVSEAAAELLARRAGRSTLMGFTKYTFPLYKEDPATLLIADTLDLVVKGQIDRLMIIAPPQHGKSELASVRLPPFWLGVRPDDPVLLASYAASLAESKSRHAREIVESGEYRSLFPLPRIRRDSRAVDRWELARPHSGGLLAVGVRGPITGHGGMLGIVDDPIENWEQAQSPTIREAIWNWWQSTFRSRIWERGAIILIMTRWHEDDLAGRLLADQGSQWSVLRLPAISETQEVRDLRNKRLGLPAGLPDPLSRGAGEPLCPSRFSLTELLRIQKDVGSLVWESLYQGSPTAPSGNRFKREWFKIVDESPAELTRCRYWDKAATEDGGARTAGVLEGIHQDGRLFIEDVVKGQWATGTRDDIILQTAYLDRNRRGNTVAIWVEQEPGSGGKESAQLSVRLLSGFPVYTERVTGSKDVRLEPFRAQCEAGNVYLVKGAWNAEYIDELISIPNGRFRDQSDASSGSYNKLALARHKTSFAFSYTRGITSP